MTRKLIRRPEQFDATKVSRKVLSLKAFVTLDEESKANIKATKIVPPRVGAPGFGRIEVEWKSPVYE